MNKQVYNVIVNVGNESLFNKGYITYHKVNNLNKFIAFINSKYPNWIFANVYDHKTKQKIETIKH
jgi:hypothetical protein